MPNFFTFHIFLYDPLQKNSDHFNILSMMANMVSTTFIDTDCRQMKKVSFVMHINLRSLFTVNKYFVQFHVLSINHGPIVEARMAKQSKLILTANISNTKGY